MSERVRTVAGRAGTLLLLLLLGGAATLGAQTDEAASAPPGTEFGAVVEVSLVDLDVYVTDREGNPVTGLTVADFEVEEDGRAVEITHFRVVEQGRPVAVPDPAETTADADAGAPRVDGVSALDPLPWEQEISEDQRLRLIVFVDNFNLRPLERNRILNSLQTFLLTQLSPEDEVMVLSYDRTLNVRQPFTRDHRLAADSLLGLRQDSGFRQARDSDRREAMQRIQRADSVELALSWARNYAESQYNELQATMDDLRQFLETLAGLPGRKALLHVSSGIPMIPGQEVYEAIDVRFGRSQGAMEAARYDGSRFFERLAAQANEYRVSFYMLDAGGLRPDEFGSAEFGSELPATGTSRTSIGSVAESNLQSPLHYLAQRSGGRAIVNITDVLAPLRQVGASLQTYYSLAYRERSPGDGRYHRIRVRVHRKGVDVRYRDGYRGTTTQDRMADRVRAALSYEFEDDSLGVEARLGTAEPQANDQYVVPLEIRVPVRELVLLPQADGQHEARMQLLVAAIDDRGRTSPIETVPLSFRLAAEYVEAAQAESFVYTHRLVVRPGRQKLAVALRDLLGARSSVLSLPLTVGRPGR